MTSDNNLRKFAIKKLLSVFGHLWVFDRMIDENAITAQHAIEKLTELRDVINPQLNLPKIECENRITALGLL